MLSSQADHSKRNHWPRCLLCIAYFSGLTIIFYCYVLLRIRPELFYHLKPDLFLLDGHFFAGFLDQPGGPIDYVSAFLSTLFAYDWLGAAVVVLLTSLICLTTRWFIAAIAARGGRFVFLIPAVAILAMLAQYMHPVRLCVGLLAALVLSNVLIRIGVGRAVLRFLAFAVVSVVAYYTIAGLYVLFALLCGIFEWGVRRHRWLGVTYVVCAAAVPIATQRWLLDLNVSQAYRGLWLPAEYYWLAVPSSPVVAMSVRIGLLMFFPVVGLVAIWRRRRIDSIVADPQSPADSERAADVVPTSRYSITRLQWFLRPALLPILGIGADLAFFDISTHSLYRMAFHAEHKQWHEVLTHSRRLNPTDPKVSDTRTVYYVNRALYHSGGLLDHMFSHTQASGPQTLTLQFDSLKTLAMIVPMERSDVLFELGRINESEHMAYEALEVLGDRPGTLQRLVQINVLKGEPEAARRFLAYMEDSLLHGRWARQYRRQLDADPTLSNVPEIATRRDLMVLRDFDGDLNVETMLLQLLERNPRNRMAFEYLMAHYLLTRQLDKVVANLRGFDDFGDSHLPRHCEEALVIYLAMGGSQGIHLGQRQISPETQRRFGEYVRTERQVRGNATAAPAALYPDFGDTYFFFYVFGYNNLSAGPSRSSR